MSKLIPLIKANIKGFVRNWKHVLLLVVMPLFLITIIFMSFNPSGLRKINIGYDLEGAKTLDEGQFHDAVGSFANPTRYDNLDACRQDLRLYKQYVCIDIKGDGPYYLDVYYDNTRESVIWEVIERINQAVDTVQKTKSKSIAADFITRFHTSMDSLEQYDSKLSTVNNDLDKYIVEVDNSATQLQNAKNDLTLSLNQMDSDIADAKSQSLDARQTKNAYYNQASSYVATSESRLSPLLSVTDAQPYASDAYNEVSQVNNELNDYNSAAESQLNSIDSKLASYQAQSNAGRQYVSSIDEGIAQLYATRSSLQEYKTRVQSARNDLQGIKTQFNGLQNMDADTIVNPVVMHDYPTYAPVVDNATVERLTGGMSQQEALAKGASFISLQTMFPIVLILITLFLSLLIGSFVALSEINAPSHTRLRLVKNIFFPEYIASFLSALIMVLIPVFIVLVIGNWIFALNIFDHALIMACILILMVSIFTMIGFLLAYTIRKESLTLMVSTFVLVLLIYFSGFLLPLERMSPVLGTLAALSPGALVLSLFNQTIFYNVGFMGVSAQLMTLFIEWVALIVLTTIVRYLRD